MSYVVLKILNCIVVVDFQIEIITGIHAILMFETNHPKNQFSECQKNYCNHFLMVCVVWKYAGVMDIFISLLLCQTISLLTSAS